MAKNKKSTDYYDLKKDAVERLVNANADTAPEVSEAEIEKFRGTKKFNIPNIVKVLFVKWWFAGAICFFFYFGLGTYITAQLDLLFVFAVALGALTDLLTNHMLRFIEKSDGVNEKYMMITTKKFWSFFLNIPYAGLLLYCVVYLYNIINTVVIQIKGVEDAVALSVEPVLFGLFYLGVDMLFIGLKHLIKNIVQDAMKTAKNNA